MLAFKDFLKAPDSFLKGHITARLARKLFGDMERLTQEALDLAGPRNDNLIGFAQFLHAENGDDVLEFLITLEDFLNAAGYFLVLFADNERVEDSARRS